MNAPLHSNPLPTTIPEYLEQLRRSLAGADPALIQDALYDAEEYLRSELAEQAAKGGTARSEAEVIASVAGSYGAPDEVADIYRDTEVKVQSALRTPPARPVRAERPWYARFFGVIAEPRTYASLFYMLLALATGIFYFTWVVTGVSLSAGLAVLIIGIPFVILYFGSIRVLSLVEGRLVEVMLGERMPRRPLYSGRGKPLLERIKELFTDPRIWATQLYFLLMLPLGIAYFTVVATLLALSLSAGLAVLIIGIPFVILYFGSIRVLSLVEGRLVEVMLGERMPRRPLYSGRGKPLLERIKELFTDPRIWATQLYFLLMLPLGIAYFTVVVTLLSLSLGFIAAPVLVWFGVGDAGLYIDGIQIADWSTWQLPLLFVAGGLLLFATLHLARGVGHLHGQLAKHMLVKSAQYG